ncbi:hypothetical protein K439DRAFT_1650933 [Ramaria rubella]|nr:hypothetical protein K439DRAFT_1650933 [Ramaria rubella]
MDHSLERLQRYSWHQSHDQATVLLLVPYETLPEDIVVIIERNYLVAGVRGQPAIIKGRLYAAVDTSNSAWQLEPRGSSRRGRTISSASSHSSFAVVSDPDISNFSTSLESGRESELEDYNDLSQSPVFSSSSSNDERAGITPRNHRDDFIMPQISGLSSPRVGPSLTSSFSSTESLHHSSRSGRLLTLHLEKAESIIWPSLVVGPVPISLATPIYLPERWQDSDLTVSEEKFNMDPTSLSLVAIDMLDIRQERNEAFEYLVRAWHQNRTSLATMRLVSTYVPLQTVTPNSSPEVIAKGTPAYFVNRIGEAGLLHLEGAASLLMYSSSTALSSLRSSEPFHAVALHESGTEGWRRDREAARRYFERAKLLDPTVDVPVLPLEGEETGSEKERKGMEIRSAAPSVASRGSSRRDTHEIGVPDIAPKRRRKERLDDSSMLDSDHVESDMWYLYLPGVVGAVIAVGVVGALSLTSWRKSQS